MDSHGYKNPLPLEANRKVNPHLCLIVTPTRAARWQASITTEVESEDQGGKTHFRPLFCLWVSCFIPHRMAGPWPEMAVHLLCVPKSPLGINWLPVTKKLTLMHLKMRHTKMWLVMTSLKPGDSQRRQCHGFQAPNVLHRCQGNSKVQIAGMGLTTKGSLLDLELGGLD